jgi:hypothetical protein
VTLELAGRFSGVSLYMAKELLKGYEFIGKVY